MVHSILKDNFHCITKIRKKRKDGDFGSGGLAIVVRKGKGIPKLAKDKGSEEILWIEMMGMDRRIFVAVVYLVPRKSSRYKNNPAVRQELEEDIIRFKKEGMVVILGDLNSRIADSLPSEGVTKNKTRENKDKVVNDNGRAWIRLTRSTGMVTLTGLFGEADYTCYNVEGNSVPDHICIDRRNVGIVSDLVNDREVMGRMSTDHSMITATLKITGWTKEEQQKKMRNRKRSDPKEKRRIRLNRIKRKEIWDKYKDNCDTNVEIAELVNWLEERDNKQNEGQSPQCTEENWMAVKKLVSTLEECAEQIALKEGDIQLDNINKRLESNSEIAVMIEEKTKAWSNLKNCKKEYEEKILRRIYNNKKNVLNKARRRIRDKLKKDKIKEIESLKPTYPGEFWKLLKAVAGRYRKNRAQMPTVDEKGNEVQGDEIKKAWKNAFEKLGKKKTDGHEFDKENEKLVKEEVERIMGENTGRGEDELNDPIRFEEVRKTINRLKNGKAAGIDEIVNEIIKYGGDPVHVVIWQLIRACFESESIPQEWMKGIIFPIYKAGDGRNPENYRGITLLCIICKIYTAVLNDRLSRWCEENDIIAEEQGGFRPGRGCVDQLYVLINILRNRIGQWTHCCFIDLRKAYDRVWRDGLWKRLWDEGIRGKMWRVCKNIYEKTQSCVLVSQERTEFFDVELGVRQGCVLSPILFSIYINTLAKEITESGIGIKIDEEKIAILLYADDIVIIADTAEDLRTGMKIATKWGKKWRCSFNQDKSKVIVFGQRKNAEEEWSLGGEKIEQVKTYKYLGLDVKGNLAWNILRERLASKTRKAMTIAWAMGVQSGHLSALAADAVWKVLVRPIAEYGAEIWGDVKWEEMEKIQRKMGKRILGLNQSTNNEVVLGEIGWWKMKARRDMLRLRYWRKIILMKRERLPRKVYEWEIKRKANKKNWTSYTKKILGELGLGEYWKKQEVKEKKDEWNRLIEERIQEREQKQWWKIVNERPKLRTYRKVKNVLAFEDYLKINDEKGRRLLSKIRSGTNFLRIETGRREGLHKKDRTCWFGCRAVEDENHFLLKCHMYNDLRGELASKLSKKSTNELELELMLGKGSREDVEQVIVFINRAVARRRRILEMKG